MTIETASSKNKVAYIESWRVVFCKSDRLLGGTIHRLGGQSHGVGGTVDHVHLLVELKATHRLADFMRELKKAASSWAHEKIPCPAFAWQEGYSAFTVSASALKNVHAYISNQEEHRRHRSFREEVLTLLRRSGVAVDERYFD